MSQKVFVNTTVIQYLYQIGLFDILGSLFGEIYVPVEVKEEIESGLREGVDLPNLLEVDFVKIYDCKCQVFLPVVRDLEEGKLLLFFRV